MFCVIAETLTSYNIKSDDMQTPENNLNENEVNE